MARIFVFLKQIANFFWSLLTGIFHFFKVVLQKLIGLILRRRGFTLSNTGASILLLILLVIIAIGARIYSNQTATKTAWPKNRPISIVAETVKKGDITVVQTSLGTVTPRNTINVQNQVSGILAHVFFKEGEDVKKGQLLAQIDPRQFEAAVKQAQGVLNKDKMLLKNARIDLKRYETLVAQDSISSQVYETQKALVDQYEGAVLADQGALDAAKVQLDYTHIRAPISGRVGLRLIDSGNYVPSNSGNLFVLTQIKPITVIFTIPQDLLPTYRQIIQMHKEDQSQSDDSAYANIPKNSIEVEAWDSANRVLLSKGRLASIDNVINLSTGTVSLKAVFENEDGHLFANQFVNIRTVLEVKKDVLTIPVKAVQIGTPGNFVYKLNDDQTVSVVPIRVGPKDHDLFLVESGLNLGDRIVTEGVDKLRDGAKVQIGDATPNSLPEKRGAVRSERSNGDSAKRDQWRKKFENKKAE